MALCSYSHSFLSWRLIVYEVVYKPTHFCVRFGIVQRRRPRHLDDDMDDANAAGQRQKKVPIGRDENIVRDAVEQTNQPANRRPFTAADHAEYDGTKFGQERAFRRTASDKTPGPRHVSGDNDRSFTCPHGTPRSTGISTTALGGQARRGEADGPGVARGTGASECGFGGGVRPCDNRGVANRKGENVHEAEAEKEALLDYVQVGLHEFSAVRWWGGCPGEVNGGGLFMWSLTWKKCFGAL